MISTTHIPLFHGHGGSMWATTTHLPQAPIAVRCPAAEVSVLDRACAHRIKLYLLDGEPLRCKGPKCPRFPVELGA